MMAGNNLHVFRYLVRIRETMVMDVEVFATDGEAAKELAYDRWARFEYTPSQVDFAGDTEVEIVEGGE